MGRVPPTLYAHSATQKGRARAPLEGLAGFDRTPPDDVAKVHRDNFVGHRGGELSQFALHLLVEPSLDTGGQLPVGDRLEEGMQTPIEFILIKSLAAMGSGAPGSYAGHN